MSEHTRLKKKCLEKCFVKFSYSQLDIFLKNCSYIIYIKISNKYYSCNFSRAHLYNFSDTESVAEHDYDQGYRRLRPKFDFSQYFKAKVCNSFCIGSFVLFFILICTIISLLLHNNDNNCE